MMEEEWPFVVTAVCQFRNPKLGQPSQWDADRFCARWFAFEVCARPMRGICMGIPISTTLSHLAFAGQAAAPA